MLEYEMDRGHAELDPLCSTWIWDVCDDFPEVVVLYP